MGAFMATRKTFLLLEPPGRKAAVQAGPLSPLRTSPPGLKINKNHRHPLLSTGIRLTRGVARSYLSKFAFRPLTRMKSGGRNSRFLSPLSLAYRRFSPPSTADQICCFGIASSSQKVFPAPHSTRRTLAKNA